MLFSKNISPLAGKEGNAVTSAKIWERLQREALRNVSIRVEKNPDDSFTVKGRGEFQMAIIAEEMRREGFEFCVGRPHVIYHTDEEGRKTALSSFVSREYRHMTDRDSRSVRKPQLAIS